MNVQIDVVDNFFDEELHDEIYFKIRDSKWSFNGGSLKNPIWHADNLEQDKFFSDYIQELIKDRFNLINAKCMRIYANGQTGGMNGDPHIDDGHLTFLYFVNKTWNVEWDGHLAFLMEMQMNRGMIGITHQMMEMKLKKWLHTNQIEEFSFPLILFTMQWLPIHFLKV